MSESYYQIEVSGRWLTVLLVALALLLVIAFAFGYGAAWSVLQARQSASRPALSTGPTPTPTPEEVVLAPSPVSVVGATATLQPTAESVPTLAVAQATQSAPSAAASAAPSATATPLPTRPPTATPREVDGESFWVQVLAAERRQAIEDAQEALEKLDFPRTHHQVERARVAGGGNLFKLRIGPFPDRASADRVAERMRISGFPDAWVVSP